MFVNARIDPKLPTAAPAQVLEDSYLPDLTSPSRTHLLLPVLIAIPLTVAAFYIDDAVVRYADQLRPSIRGDVLRVLQTLQQYGDATYVILAALFVLMLDRARRRFVLDLIFAALITLTVSHALKILLGRPRPSVGDHTFLAGPFAYPIESHGKLVMLHSWNIFTSGASKLWSMPSSHTSAAAAMSVFFWHHYPRLRIFALFMVVFVGSLRVLFGAHHLSDVIMGAGVGFTVASLVIVPRLFSRRYGKPRYGTILDIA